MGYTVYNGKLSVRASRHHDERDIEDNMAINQLNHEIEQLCMKPEYEDISADWMPIEQLPEQ